MNYDSFLRDGRQIFSMGIKGILILFPIKRIVKESIFKFSTGAAVVLTFILFFFPALYLSYIDLIINLSISIIPSILGLSLAGFAIVINQVNKETLERIAVIKDNERSSLYQKTNAAFSITVLTQLLVLFFVVFVKLLKPITLQIPVPDLWAIIVNLAVFGLGLFLFVFALLSVVQLVVNIFNSGQIVNFIFMKNKLIDEQEQDKDNK